MKATNTYSNLQMKNGVATIQSDARSLQVGDLISGGLIGNNLAQSMFTYLVEYDDGFAALINTKQSKVLKAMRDATNAGDTVPIYGTDKDGQLVLENIPNMSFSPMTAQPDDCCVIAGDLQVCKDATVLKEICLEKCRSGIERMAGQIGVAGSNSAVYAAYKQMLVSSGIKKEGLPTIEQFEQLGLIAQFIVLNMITFINGILDVEQNGNIVRRFSGLAQVYTNPDVYTIDGGAGILEAFQQTLCRINLIGQDNFSSGFYLADTIAYTAIQQAVIKKADGLLPVGWEIRDVTVTQSDGSSYTKKDYYFNGIRIIKSRLVYVDTETLVGNIYYVPETVGVFSGVPTDMPAEFIQAEYDKNGKSAFVHWDEEKKAYPDCWSECDRLTNFGAVVSTEANNLIAITNIGSVCDKTAYKGIEGLFNINSYSPFIR